MTQTNGNTVPGPKLNVCSPGQHRRSAGYILLTIVQGNTFLFTSESVGEGHPDKIA